MQFNIAQIWQPPDLWNTSAERLILMDGSAGRSYSSICRQVHIRFWGEAAQQRPDKLKLAAGISVNSPGLPEIKSPE
ncbi:hypothetical protein [Kamptonema formosum]|uniref:hypothetical protein n=1 Tax=Kamptonema formosum TaxID=331992 RepID=UPI00037A2C83|nr:hypothetical protein [Oscillatoria sp. PCC 10802]